jgi:hypothetical protein
MNMSWYFDEMVVIERMREAQRKADRAQALGLIRHGRIVGWEQVRMALGRGLVALGNRLQQADPDGRPDLSSPSQCALR